MIQWIELGLWMIEPTNCLLKSDAKTTALHNHASEVAINHAFIKLLWKPAIGAANLVKAIRYK